MKTAPEETVRCVVSLDGVTVLPDGDEEARRREASCETVSFQDADDNRLKTLSFRSEAGKATLKAQLAEEVAHVRKARPEVGRRRCARQLDVSQEAPARRTGGRLFPAPLSEVSDHAGASNWYEKCRAVLRDDVDGFGKVATRRLRDKATAGPTSKVFERELGFFPQGQAPYALREPQGCALGSGIVDAANKVLINQRMKQAHRSGGRNILAPSALVGPSGMAPGVANENQALNFA